MSFPQGIDCRNTSGYVTDPPNCAYYNLAGGYPQTTPQGNVVGTLASGYGINQSFSALDRNSALDPRLAGVWYLPSGSVAGFEIDLPSTGTFNINMAMGDDSAATGSMSCLIYDNLSLLQTVVSNVTPPQHQWYDATGTLRTSAAAWVASNPQGGGGTGTLSLTFSSTKMVVIIQSNGNFSSLNHIWVQQPGSGIAVPSATALFVLP